MCGTVGDETFGVRVEAAGHIPAYTYSTWEGDILVPVVRGMYMAEVGHIRTVQDL